MSLKELKDTFFEDFFIKKIKMTEEKYESMVKNEESYDRLLQYYKKILSRFFHKNISNEEELSEIWCPLLVHDDLNIRKFAKELHSEYIEKSKGN